jgi:hypothetical protein
MIYGLLGSEVFAVFFQLRQSREQWLFGNVADLLLGFSQSTT